MAKYPAKSMVILSVLFTTLCLQLVSSRRLSDEIDNEIGAMPDGNIADYEYKESRDYVKITQAPPTHMKKNVGAHLELYCEAMGSPPPIIQWYKDNLRLTENDIYESSNTIKSTPGLGKVSARLVINYILPRHEGKYYCVAEAGPLRTNSVTDLVIPNGRGREMNLTQLIANKILGAHHRPRVTFWAPVYMDVIGSDVILPCKFVGNPRPDIIWFDNNSKIIEDDKKFEISTDGELSIRSITWDDMGVFTCMIKNVVGEDTVETFLYPMRESQKQ